MKRLVVTLISSFVLGSLSTPVLAESVALNVNTGSCKTSYQIQTVDLVGIAYKGFLSAQKIPSAGSFITSARSSKVTPESLVKAAIAQGCLSPDTLNNPYYLSLVKTT